MKEHELIYKYSYWDENCKDAVEKRYFWFSKPTNFNDPFDSNMEILKAFEKSNEIFERSFNETDTIFNYIKRNTNDFGVLCFTSKTESGKIGDKGYNNLHFWSHYANCYKGINIGFDKSSIENYYSEKLRCNASLSKINYFTAVRKFQKKTNF